MLLNNVLLLSRLNHHTIHGSMLFPDDDKPYPCDYCDYRCKQMPNLLAHMRVHTGNLNHSSLIMYLRLLLCT